MEYEGVNWIHLAQDKKKWRVVLNTEMKVCIPHFSRISRLTVIALASQEGIFKLQLVSQLISLYVCFCYNRNYLKNYFYAEEEYYIRHFAEKCEQNIEGGSKVGIQFIVNYCIPTLAYPILLGKEKSVQHIIRKGP